MDKANHLSQHAQIISADIHALSWNIATEPKLYWKLAPNPYSPRALQIIAEKFPDVPLADVIKAVVLAEPEGIYDRNFRLLGAEQQAESLRNQKELAIKINNKLVHYCDKHKKKFHRLPRNIIYENLSIVVFENADLKTIEQQYSQKQRRELRLAIITFIEDRTNVSVHESTEKKITHITPFLNVFFAALIFILLSYLATTLYAKQPEPKQNQNTAPHLDIQGLPMRLKIPKITVDSPIEYVGVTSDGAMGVPTNTSNVGWFNLGPRPGEKGSAVIAGHYDGENGTTGVFTNLDKLKEGDKLFIEYRRGISLTFVVRDIRTYDPGYAENVFSENDIAHLNLITCDGVWDGAKKSYSKRLVVFTDLLY